MSRPIKVPPILINTTTESLVGSYRPDRFSPDQYNFLDKELPRLLDLRVLRTSTSLYNSPILLKEKAGPVKWRMTNDFRELNANTTPFPAVVPIIADVMEAISEGKIFSKMDMTQGFLQMELDEASKKKTAFRCFKGVFEFNVAGLGMKNVPSYFLYGISNIFFGPKKDCKLIF